MAAATLQQKIAQAKRNLKDPAFKNKKAEIQARIKEWEAQLAGGPTTPTNTPIATPTPSDTPPSGPDINASDKVEKGLKNDIAVEDFEADKRGRISNPNISTPVSDTNVTIDPVTGRPTVTTKLSEPQQKIWDSSQGLSQIGLDLAKQRAGEYKPLTFGENVGFDRQKAFDEAFGYLTRGMDTQYQQEKDQLEQTLANRGISLDPRDPQYKSYMDDLNRRYDTLKANAKAQAFKEGGEEMSRDYGITASTHNINMGDIGTMSGWGMGPQMPNSYNYNAPSYDIPSASELDLAYKGLAETIRNNKANQPRGGGGGGGGGAPAPVNNPFSDKLPPYYTG